MDHGEPEQRLFRQQMMLGKQNLYGSLVKKKLLQTPVKIVPVNDVSSVSRACVVGFCSGAADSPYKCERIMNVKHNLLKPGKEELSSLLRSEVLPSTELSHNICWQV